MTTPHARSLAWLTRRLAAREGAGFHGRARELAVLQQAIADAARGLYRCMAITGPMGAGRRELLRQTALHAWSSEGAVLPLVWEADATPYAAENPTPRAGNPWPLLLGELLRLALLRLSERDPRGSDPAGVLTATPADLPARCARLGAFSLIQLAERLPRAEAGQLGPLLQALAGLHLPPPVLLVSASGPELPPALVPVLAAFRRAGVLTVTTALPPPPAFADFPELEQLPLAPLEAAEAQALAAAVGHRRGWSLAPAVLEPILARLGPWPGWVLAWCAQFRPPGPSGNGLRAAEEAYVRLLMQSGWARALEYELAGVLPAALQGPVMDLLHQALRPGAGLTVQALGMAAGLRPAEADAVLRGLLRCGLLTATPEGLAGPRWPALRDWLLLAGDPPAASGLFTPRQLELLARLLAAPRAVPEGHETPAEPGAGLLTATLRAFEGQAVPEVLFDFAAYHEALGRLAPAQRRETLAHATHSRPLPEVIGLTRLEGPMPVLVARGFGEGKYQRSHEQTWLVADLSAARLATTPEVRQALEAFARAEAELGIGRYTRWLIIGEGASAEALALIRQEKLLCACREQVAFLHGLVQPEAAPRRGGEPAPVPPPPEPAGTHRPPPGPPPPVPSMASVAPVDGTPAPALHAVVDLHAPAPPANELSRLALPAREGSEYIAAMLAEKLALRAEFSAADAGKIKTAVLEGVLNAIEHSPNPEKLVEVEFRQQPGGLEIVIENEGAVFDPLAVPVPEARAKLTARNKRGWGISLMRQFMDELDYDPCARGTRLRLFKRRPAAPGPVREAPPGTALGKG